MNATKKKILEASLRLFNAHGVAEVSLRNIAEAIPISIGNLQYHFRKREEIIEALYHQLVERIDAVFVPEGEDLLAAALQVPVLLFQAFSDYPFFFIDFVGITRNHPKIKKHYADLSKRRKQEFLAVINQLVEKGILRKEELVGEYHSLYQRIELISNFWFSAQLIQREQIPSTAAADYAQQIKMCMYPYLIGEAKSFLP